MKGKAPVRRTLQYLEHGPLHLKDGIQIMTINYNTGQQKSNKGVIDFMFWHLPQLMYKNPNTQFVTFKNMTPSPFFQFFFSNGRKLLVDVDSQTKDEIHDFIKQSVCKSQTQLFQEQTREMKNPAFFGPKYDRKCICQIPGQCPCSGYVILPPEMRGKIYLNKESD